MSQNTQATVATKSKFSVRDICYAGLFAAVIAVMAQISIPMPLGVPMTMQTFAITLAAVVLGSKLSAIASLVPGTGRCGRASAGKLLRRFR